MSTTVPPPKPQANRFIEVQANKEDEIKRRKTCRFIEEAGRVLKLPRVAISTAEVFFHRFYAKHSFADHDRFEVAVAAIVLAAKTEESPKKLNTVIIECYKLKARGQQQGRISQQKLPDGSSPPPPKSPQHFANLDPKGDEFLKLKERILLLERIILHTIGFELSIDHPYKFFVEKIKRLIFARKLQYKNGNPPGLPTKDVMQKKMLNELMQYSTSATNDSYQTSLCLQFPPNEIATACLYLAGQFAGVEPIDGNWRTALGDPDIEDFVSICVQILDLMSEKKASDTEQFNKIRAGLTIMKTEKGLHGGSSKHALPTPEGRNTPPPPGASDSNKRPRHS